jgi:translation initiation factor IF-3
MDRRRPDTTRINQGIRVREVRLIDPDGNQVGILPIHQALAQANDYGLDLVEISPNAKPPVCKIMDYGRFKYEQTKKQQEAKKKANHFSDQGDQGSSQNRRARSRDENGAHP